MDLLLENKIIIISGGASGIGKAIAIHLAEEHAIPCVMDRDEGAILTLEAEMYSQGYNMLGIVTELTDRVSCTLAIGKIILKYGQIDGLVNNAGINDGVGLQYGDERHFTSSLVKNVGHYFSLTYLALPELKKTRGRIVNICSKVAETGQGGSSGYAAANGIRMELTTQWASEFLPDGIQVNAVVVAECWTPQYEWWINQLPDPPQKLQEIKKSIPLGSRMTTTTEVATTVVFLLSRMAGSINGEFIHVDGGYVHLDRGIGR